MAVELNVSWVFFLFKQKMWLNRKKMFVHTAQERKGKLQ
jgi:hypothetical protein